MKTTTTQATETIKTAHTPLCCINGDCFDICRCTMFAKSRAEIAAMPRITFRGPVGKGPEIHGREPRRDAWEATKRLF